MNGFVPSSCDWSPFDDALWVETTKRDHLDFVLTMRDGRSDIVEMHNLLTEPWAQAEAPNWIIGELIIPDLMRPGLIDKIKSCLMGLAGRELAETQISGRSTEDFPMAPGGETLKAIRDVAGSTETLLPSLPNTVYTRDINCWIYGNFELNAL
jgi:arginine deiminase